MVATKIHIPDKAQIEKSCMRTLFQMQKDLAAEAAKAYRKEGPGREPHDCTTLAALAGTTALNFGFTASAYGSDHARAAYIVKSLYALKKAFASAAEKTAPGKNLFQKLHSPKAALLIRMKRKTAQMINCF